MQTKNREPIYASTNKYIGFIEIASGVVRASRPPPYSSRFSKKTYNQHQLMAIVLFKE